MPGPARPIPMTVAQENWREQDERATELILSQAAQKASLPSARRFAIGRALHLLAGARHPC